MALTCVSQLDHLVPSPRPVDQAYAAPAKDASERIDALSHPPSPHRYKPDISSLESPLRTAPVYPQETNQHTEVPMAARPESTHRRTHRTEFLCVLKETAASCSRACSQNRRMRSTPTLTNTFHANSARGSASQVLQHRPRVKTPRKQSHSLGDRSMDFHQLGHRALPRLGGLRRRPVAASRAQKGPARSATVVRQTQGTAVPAIENHPASVLPERQEWTCPRGTR